MPLSTLPTLPCTACLHYRLSFLFCGLLYRPESERWVVPGFVRQSETDVDSALLLPVKGSGLGNDVALGHSASLQLWQLQVKTCEEAALSSRDVER